MRNQLLRDADWAGMAHSIEIRMPFVVLPLLQTAMAGIAGHPEMKKVDFLGPILEGRFAADLRARPKTGFSVRVRHWLAHGEEERSRPRPARLGFGYRRTLRVRE